MDYHGSEGHLEFALFDLDDATGYLGALGNYRFSIHLDRLGEAGGKGVTDFVFVGGQRLSNRRADGRAFRQGDHCCGFRRFGYGGRFCCGSRFCCVGFLRRATGFVSGRLRAARCRQNGCRCQSKPEAPMHLRVEHFTPPKGHPWGEWDEVAGWTLHQSKLTDRLRNDGYPLPTLNRTESGRWSACAFPARVSFPAPAYRPVCRAEDQRAADSSRRRGRVTGQILQQPSETWQERGGGDRVAATEGRRRAQAGKKRRCPMPRVLGQLRRAASTR